MASKTYKNAFNFVFLVTASFLPVGELSSHGYLNQYLKEAHASQRAFFPELEHHQAPPHEDDEKAESESLNDVKEAKFSEKPEGKKKRKLRLKKGLE